MIRHIVLIRLNPEASEAQAAAWRAAVHEMCRFSAQVLSYTFGDNIGSGPNHHDAALVADFETWDTFRAYIDSDAHKAYVADHARHVVSSLAAIQHEV